MTRSTAGLLSWSLIALGCASQAPSPTPPGPASASNAPLAASDPTPPLASVAASSAPPSASASVSPVAPAALAAIPPNTAVLHVGDSFVLAGFSQALRMRFKDLGARYEVKSEQSSFTVSWASRMEKIVADTQPDLVIINLGANEVLNVDPPAHAPAVRRIVKSVGDRPCVWIMPPLWLKDTGIRAVIRENSAPCRFFDSNVLVKEEIQRQGDHIHPTEKGGAVWADAFWAWLQTERSPDEPTALGRKSPWRLKPSPVGEHGDSK